MQVSRLFKGVAALAVVAGAIGAAAAGIEAGPPAAARIAAADASPDGIGFASPHAAGVREPSHADAWGGARTAMEPTLADRVVSYTIAATLDPTRHTIAGTERLTWRNRSQREVRTVYLHLYLNAFEGSQTTYSVESRIPAFKPRTDIPNRDGEWGHIELTKVAEGDAAVPWRFVHPDGGPDTDHTVVRLDLPTAVAPGTTVALDIAFLDQLPRIKARTGYFGSFHLVGQWFPKIGVLELPGERGAASTATLGELIRGALREYGRMLRMMFMAVVPLGIALGLAFAAFKGVQRYGEHAILKSAATHARGAAFALSGLLVLYANASVDAGRAFLALHPGKRSVIKTWWRGLTLVLARPRSAFGPYLVITLGAVLALAAASWLRVELPSASVPGLVLGFLTTQLIVAITACMHFARLYALLEVTQVSGVHVPGVGESLH